MSILNGNEVPRMHSAEISWALRFHVNSTKKGPNNLSKSGQSSRSGPCGRSTPVNLNGKNRLENNIETSRHCQHFRFTTCVTSFVLLSVKLHRMLAYSARCATRAPKPSVTTSWEWPTRFATRWIKRTNGCTESERRYIFATVAPQESRR